VSSQAQVVVAILKQVDQSLMRIARHQKGIYIQHVRDKQLASLQMPMSASARTPTKSNHATRLAT
jgi:hypothetical protein